MIRLPGGTIEKRPVKRALLKQSLSAVIAATLIGILPFDRAEAKPVPALPAVSPAIAAAYPHLVSRRAELIGERNALRDRTSHHNNACRSVEEDSSEAARCDDALCILPKRVHEI
ncbi:MAG: hypothetical protein ACKVQA_23200 [Burkholderiales bacterium]